MASSKQQSDNSLMHAFIMLYDSICCFDFSGRILQSVPSRNSSLCLGARDRKHTWSLTGALLSPFLSYYWRYQRKKFPCGSVVKNLPAKQETQVRSLGQEDLLEKEMATHSSILVWEIPWTEEPGGRQSKGLQRGRAHVHLEGTCWPKNVCRWWAQGRKEPLARKASPFWGIEESASNVTSLILIRETPGQLLWPRACLALDSRERKHSLSTSSPLSPPSPSCSSAFHWKQRCCSSLYIWCEDPRWEMRTPKINTIWTQRGRRAPGS